MGEGGGSWGGAAESTGRAARSKMGRGGGRLGAYSVAPCQLEPAPAVQAKQWLPVGITREIKGRSHLRPTGSPEASLSARASGCPELVRVRVSSANLGQPAAAAAPMQAPRRWHPGAGTQALAPRPQRGLALHSGRWPRPIGVSTIVLSDSISKMERCGDSISRAMLKSQSYLQSVV